MAKGAELSKAGLRFVNRVDFFDDDIEFVELLYKERRNVLPSSEGDCLFLGMTDDLLLSRKKVSEQSRTIVIAHLRATVYVSFIKEIYEELTEYLRSLLEEASLICNDKTRAYTLIGDAKCSITASELLQFTEIQEVHKTIADQVMRQIENERSTVKLVQKICDRLNISVDQNTIDEALPYLELRHLLVHADGKADQSFREKYKKSFKISKGKVELNNTVVKMAKDKITCLVRAIDKEAVDKGIMKENNAK